MTTFILYTRSFHPKSNFGLAGFLFRGDNRGFSDNENVTSRIRHKVVFSIDPPNVIKYSCESDPSMNAVTGTTENYTNPAHKPTSAQSVSGTPYAKTGMQSVHVHIEYGGQNLAIPSIPPLYSKINDNDQPDPNGQYRLPADQAKQIVPVLRAYHDLALTFEHLSDKASVKSNVYGSGFPNCESFLIDEAQKSLFLGTHVRFGSASGQLWGNPRNAMSHAFLRVDMTPECKFGSTLICYQSMDYHNGISGTSHFEETLGGGAISIEKWNSFHRNRDPSDGMSWLRDNVPFGRGLLPTSEKSMPPATDP